MIAVLIAGMLATTQQVGPADYEGIAHDSFAAWSIGYSVSVKGPLRSTSVMVLYDTPTPYNGNPTPVRYSLHQIQVDCGAKTVTWMGGGNYSGSNVLLSPATPTGALPWTDGTPGFQTVATTLCAIQTSY